MKQYIFLTVLACGLVLVGCKSGGMKCPLKKTCKSKMKSEKPIEQVDKMKKRVLYLSKLKPECVEEYKKYHANVWPELLAAYKEAGIKRCNCFLNGVDLIVYVEYGDNGTMEEIENELSQNEYQMKWEKAMKPLFDSSVEMVEFEEVFHLE